MWRVEILATQHNRYDLSGICNVEQWIRAEHKEVRELPGRYSSMRVAHPRELG